MQRTNDAERSRKLRAIERKREKKTLLYQRISFAAICISILLFLLCIALFVMQSIELCKQNDLSDLYHGNAQASEFSLFPSAYAEELHVEQNVPERFEELFKINPDLIGWLSAGDAVDGPVVYRDNEHYMDHNFYNEYSKSGTIFADAKNADWLNDSFVILYGHNMRNGSMFGKLGQYRKTGYLKEYPIITFDTIAQESADMYVPFAVFDASMEVDNENFFHLRRFEYFQSEDQTLAAEYLNEVLDRSLYTIPVEVTPMDRVLVLVTCSYDNPNGRLMLFCRELREGETAEGIEELINNAL